MDYELVVKSEFSAAHRLRSYKGEAEGLHGHNWGVEARITAEGLDGEGLLLDFADAQKCLSTVLGEFDHRNINDLSQFAEQNPTTELRVKYIYDRLRELLGRYSAELVSVTLWETPECGVTYRSRR
jgi:6-pyruvoyltetrahydropterin/6-carboxytetrahydropterin synthase